ncbi:MAG: lysyl oxidase family protein [Actinomycetota bacterium]|nr:lysyl oxidase family protein [Actinomycetota bacterium]
MTRRGIMGVFAALAVVVAGLAAVPANASHTSNGELLPDLQTLEPADLTIGTVSGRKAVRLSNTIGNNHTGPLEVFPGTTDCDNDGVADNSRTAFQRIYRDANGNGTFNRGIDPESRTVSAGCMIYHEEHSHWHFEGFSEYALYRLDGQGRRGPLVGVSKKTSFCIGDFAGRQWALAGAPNTGYYGTCTRTSTQGLSVGWADIYQYYLEGQSITLPLNTNRGWFCLVSTADPENRLVETDNTDNTESIRFSLSGSRINARRGSSC